MQLWATIWIGVTFCTTDPTLSPSLLKMLCRCIVDHQTLPVVCSLFLSRQFPSWPKSSSTLPYAKITITLSFGTSLVNGLHSTHVYSPKISDYGHAQSTYHMFSFPCHTFISFIPHATFIIPHVVYKSSTCSLPFITCYVSSFQYISFEYLSCISPVLNFKLVHPPFSLRLRSLISPSEIKGT